AYTHRLLLRAPVLYAPPAASGAAPSGPVAGHGGLPGSGHASGPDLARPPLAAPVSAQPGRAVQHCPADQPVSCAVAVCGAGTGLPDSRGAVLLHARLAAVSPH